MWPELYNLWLVLECVSGSGWTQCPEFNSSCGFSRTTTLPNFSVLVIHSSNSSQQMLSLYLSCYFLISASAFIPVDCLWVSVTAVHTEKGL